MGASVVAALLNLQLDLRSRMNRELRDYGPNVVIQSEQTGGFVPHDFPGTLQGSNIRRNLVAFSPQLVVPAQVQQQNVVISVIDVEAYRKLFSSHEWNMREGSSTADSIFIGKRLSEKLQLTGDQQDLTLRILQQEKVLPVGGTVESGETEDDQILMPVQTAEKLGITRNGYHSILLSALGELQDVEREFAALLRQNPGLQYKMIRKIAAAESTILDKISRLMGLVVFFIFVILFFCIHTTVSAILISRQSEIALLRVLGARRKQITSVLTAELLLLGLVGGAAGYALGIFMAQLLGKVLFQSFIVPSAIVFAITLLFSLFLMFVSSLLPISRAVNRQAALVLKEA
jgi:putative ABC transport system permease protein